MNILFTLCGRAGSKGVRGKNARDFMEIPLCWYSLTGISLYIKNHVSANDQVDIVLNTDSEDLIRLVEDGEDDFIENPIDDNDLIIHEYEQDV